MVMLTTRIIRTLDSTRLEAAGSKAEGRQTDTVRSAQRAVFAHERTLKYMVNKMTLVIYLFSLTFDPSLGWPERNEREKTSLEILHFLF